MAAINTFCRFRASARGSPGYIVGMKQLLLLLAISFAPSARAGNPAEDSSFIVQAALDQIQWTLDTHDTVTDCSIYVSRVLARAGMPVGGFSSNDFDKVMATHLPSWRHAEFSTENPGADQEVLRNFLNGAPDGTVFLAQWPRVSQSGHVAIVEKISLDHFLIYQAQKGLPLPHASTAHVSQLLYPSSSYGGRAHLRLFFE